VNPGHLPRLELAARDDGDAVRRPRQRHIDLGGRNHERLGHGTDPQLNGDARRDARDGHSTRLAQQARRRCREVVSALSKAIDGKVPFLIGRQGRRRRRGAERDNRRAANGSILLIDDAALDTGLRERRAGCPKDRDESQGDEAKGTM
jgi:hypothetical protein